MRFDAVLFDNGGTLTHRTSPVATVRALAARSGVDVSEEDAARYWRRSKEHSRALMSEKRERRNLSRADHREAYVAGYAPFDGIAPGLAELMYDEWKTNPLTMVPYPDAPATLKSFSGAGLPIAIVSNTGWSIDAGYAATGLDAFIATFVLSCDLGIAKPDPEPFLIACERLGVPPERTLMVGNNRLADSGSICVGCHCLILPPVPPGATRGLRAAVDVAGIPWARRPAGT
ncbi:MAG: HAD family hydrolase [Streptosporangiaceae bacterium]